MIARAITHGYPITDEQRKALLSVLLRVALDPSNSPREKTAAARAIMAADQLNIEREKMSQADDHHGDQLDAERMDRVAAVAQQLGLTRVVEAIAIERSGSHSDATIEQAKDDASNNTRRKDP
jgi:plasmid stability protein